ncbi:RnfABCDGE type electron transport complex subunit G [Proteiniclasticum sp.]|uniref:RnfABCDGE type electron transport complex subunit G n=1 Tax=Proteiniclasticum sp. TaxID=2053595 RepID=UPI0028A0A9EE|nr:RnfABCDGE type electron transport complex subunit G [Proteiniclasticum sp.]
MKNKNILRELLTLGGTLTLICVIVAGIVAVVFNTTKEQIAMNNAVNAEDLALVMPESDAIEDVTDQYDEHEIIREVYKATSGTETVGYVYKMITNGYKPELGVLVGIDNEGNTIAAKITQSSETPGLGALVAEDAFITQFTGKETASSFQVVKTTPAGASEIQAVSGATISSTAVTSAINDAVKFHKENILGEEVVEVPVVEPTFENMKMTGDEMAEISGELKTLEVKTAGEVTGYIVYGSGTGYYEDKPIKVAVGFDNATETITNILIIEQNETPGIGDAILQEGLTELFQGAAAEEQATQVYSGASESSKGVYKAVNQAILYYHDVLMKEPTIENMRLTGDEMAEISGEYRTFEVKTAGEVTGYIVYASNPGYYEDKPIEVAVSFDVASKQVKNIMVVKQNETQGIGTKISEEAFTQLFQDKPSEEMSVQIYSGASESSKGVYKAVNKAILYFNDVLMQGGN